MEALKKHTTSLAKMAQLNAAINEPVSIIMTFNITWSVIVADSEGEVICAGKESKTLLDSVLSAITDWEGQYMR